MPLPLATVSRFDAPSLTACVDLYLRGSFPLNLAAGDPAPWGAPFGESVYPDALLGAPPWRVSTRDVALAGRPFYRGLLAAVPTWDQGRELGRVDQVTLDFDDPTGELVQTWFRADRELEGKLVHVHLVDVATNTWAERAWVGAVFRVFVPAQFPGRVSLVCTRYEPGPGLVTIPRVAVTAATFPSAPAAAQAPPTGGLGSLLAEGLGVGVNLPGRLVHAQLSTADLAVWAICPALGTGVVHAVRYAGTELTPGIDWVPAYRDYRPEGRPCLAVRAGVAPYIGTSPVPITCDVERRTQDDDPDTRALYPWAHDLVDVLGGHTVLTTTEPTRYLVTGRSRYRFGAVSNVGLTGVVDPLRFRDWEGWSAQTFTLFLDVDLGPQGDGVAGVLLHSARRAVPGPVPHGWVLEALNGVLQWSWNTLTLTPYTLTVVVPDPLKPFSLALRMGDGGGGNRLAVLSVYQDGATVTASTTFAVGVLYQTEISSRVGDTLHGAAFQDDPNATGLVTAAEWTLGWLRHDDAFRSDAWCWREHCHRIGAPAELMRRFAEHAGETVDPDSYQAATAAFDDDRWSAAGWLTTPTAAAVAYGPLALFRDLRPSRGETGLFTFDVWTPPTEAVPLGVGAPRLSATLNGRGRLPASERTRVATFAYRPHRDVAGVLGGGAVGEFDHTLAARCGAVGIDRTIACPYVWRHDAMDMVRQFFARVARAETEVLELVDVDHLARGLARNDVLALTLAHHGLSNAPYRVLAVVFAGATVDVTLAPFDETLFDPIVAGDDVPDDAPVPPLAQLTVGPNPTLVLAPMGGGELAVDVFLGSIEPVAVANVTYAVEFYAYGTLTRQTRTGPRLTGTWAPTLFLGTYVSGPVPYVGGVGVSGRFPEALAWDGGPTSYLEGSISAGVPAGLYMAHAPHAQLRERPVTAFRVAAVVDRLGAGGVAPLEVRVALMFGGTTYTSPVLASLGLNQGATVGYTWDRNPATEEPWTVDALDEALVGLEFAGANNAAVHIQALRGEVWVGETDLGALDTVRLYARPTVANPPTQPPAPRAGVPDLTRPYLAGHVLGLSPGWWHVWAVLFDVYRRPLLELPPAGTVAAVEVT